MARFRIVEPVAQERLLESPRTVSELVRSGAQFKILPPVARYVGQRQRHQTR